MTSNITLVPTRKGEAPLLAAQRGRWGKRRRTRIRSIFQFLPLLVVLCLYAAFVRLAARAARASGIGWLQAFQFAALVVVLSVLGRVASLYIGQAPLLVAGLLGIALHLVLGAWFFGKRALASNGQLVGWGGGAKLTAVAIGLLFITMLVFFGVVRALLPTVQP